MSLKKTLTEAASCARHCGSKSHSLFLLGWSAMLLHDGTRAHQGSTVCCSHVVAKMWHMRVIAHDAE